MNDSIKYAKSLQEKYHLPSIDTSQLTGNETTVYEVASKVLDKPTLIQWLKDGKQETKELRQRYNIKPFNKFDKETDELITKLEA